MCSLKASQEEEAGSRMLASLPKLPDIKSLPHRKETRRLLSVPIAMLRWGSKNGSPSPKLLPCGQPFRVKNSGGKSSSIEPLVFKSLAPAGPEISRQPDFQILWDQKTLGNQESPSFSVTTEHFETRTPSPGSQRSVQGLNFGSSVSRVS